MTISTRLAGLASVMLVCASNPMKAADTTCGSRQCEEAICSSADVLKCSDWNDLGFDGWSPFPHLYRNGGTYGDVVAGKGMNGTAAWEHKIQPYFDETIFADTSIAMGTGPVYARFYTKFSPGYQFMMICGLQKQFYFMQGTQRIMVGVMKANNLGGSYASLPNTVGVFGFDYYGHIIELPNKAGDNATLIYPDRWYSVETMVDANTKTVKMWIDGQLQMTRSGYTGWTDGSSFNIVREDSWFGGDPTVCSKATQTQYVWHDNHVISRSYIGPIGGSSGGGTTPQPPVAPVLLPN